MEKYMFQWLIFITFAFQGILGNLDEEIASNNDVVPLPENEVDDTKKNWEWELLDLSVGGNSWSWKDGIGKWVTWLFHSIDGSDYHGGGIKFHHVNEEGQPQDYLIITWLTNNSKSLTWHKRGLVHGDIVIKLPEWTMTEKGHTWGFRHSNKIAGFTYDDELTFGMFK